MRSRRRVFFFIVAFILFTIAGPRTLLAAEIQLFVNNAANAACSTPSCFTTIQAAIEYANPLYTANTGTTYSILVEPGTYAEAITLKSGVTNIHGRETARTFLTGNGSTAVITVNNLSAEMSIRNFSIINASTGILVSNKSFVDITNNVFYNISGTAVTIQGSPSTKVINNTFDLNGTAVARNSDINQITNNIFTTNTVHISGASFPTDQSNITYNDFNNPTPSLGEIRDPNSLPNSASQNTFPSFADISNVSHPDFHLQTVSPCKGIGDPNQGMPQDFGAYGGTFTDTIPMQVFNVIATAPTTTISVDWSANLAYDIAGYRVWYGRTSGGPYDGTGATEGASPINVTTIAATLSGLSTTVPTPAQPKINLPVTVQNESLVLNWDAVAGATGYRVYADIDDGTSSPPTTLKATVNTTSYPLTGLTNNVKYKIAVSAIAQAIYYVAVTAVNTALTDTSTPGISHESAYSQEVSVPLGDVQEGVQSDFLVDYPEALVAYPNLQNSRRGCFIATAAYGSYSAPEVQALRAFRDRYLLTNSAGSAFVRWYYEHGPVAAAWLDAHPGYKPVVRAALLPAVGLALFMTTSLFIKTVVALLMFIALIIANSYFRKRFSGSGGA